MITKKKTFLNCDSHGELHDYTILQEDRYGIVEYCTKCKTTLYVNKSPRTERIDDITYAEEHIRDILTPNQRRFQHEYK